MPRLIIDDLEIEVPAGTKVIEAAERLGIMIPRFCYHEAMGSVGACRMCAVKFLQGPFKGVQMSCMIDAQDGMVVSTTDPEAVEFRRQVIEWLMLNHPHDCPVCDEGGQCLLQDETVSGGHGMRRFWGKKRTYRDQNLGPFIAHEMNRCIHCYRCSRFYQIFSGYKDLGTMQIGNRVYFGRYADGKLESPFSGNLVDICPTGVYTDKTARFKIRRWDLNRSQSVCLHCSLGCNTVANTHYRGVMRIEARFNSLVNGYFICDLGRFGFSYANGGANHESRPWNPKMGAEVMPYDQALAKAAEKLAEISRNAGPGAVASLGSMRNSLETQSALRRLCRKQGWKEPSFFVNSSVMRKVKTAASRLDKRVAVSLREIEKADFIVAMGVDPINEAPMLAYSMRQAFRNGAPVVLIDPRPVSLPLDFVHLPVSPRDIDTCLGVLIKGALSSDFDDSHDAAATELLNSLPDAYLADAGIQSAISALAPRLAASRRPVIICGTDVTRDHTPSVAADHALLLKYLKDGAGLFYTLPGPNAFGAALSSSSEDQSFMDILEAIEAGSVKALLVVENDIARSFHNRKRLENALSKLDLLVVLDYLPSDAAKRADIFLPTSTVFEAGSSFVNQEGRVQFAEKAHQGGVPLWGGSHPPRAYDVPVPGGGSKGAWQILFDMTRALTSEDFPDSSIQEVMEDELPIFQRCGKDSRPANGILLIPEKSDSASFSLSKGSATVEPPPRGIFELIPVQWLFGTEELSAYSDVMQGVETEPFLLMHHEDASIMSLADGDDVDIELDGGLVGLRLRLSSNMARGIVLMPRHRRIEWEKMEGFPALMPFNRIRKAGLS